MNPEEESFLTAINSNPKDVASQSAYADWLDEHERPYEAALQRAEVGLSELYYMLRRKSDGLFSNGRKLFRRWHERRFGRMWRSPGEVLSHLGDIGRRQNYRGTPWVDLEVVFFEVRITSTMTLPLKTDIPKRRCKKHTITEPIGGGRDQSYGL